MGAWRDIARLNGVVRASINRVLLEEAGLTLTDTLLLCEVAHSPGNRLRMAELAESLGVAKSAVTKTVDRLEERVLLVRERGVDDRRVVAATLTDDGYEMFVSTMPVLVEAVAERFSVLTDEETRQLRALVRKVLAAEPATGLGDAAAARADVA